MPRVLGAENLDFPAEPWRYRLRSRLCGRQGVIELQDLDGAGEGLWGRLQGIALRGAAVHEVPLISPAKLVVEHIAALAQSRFWHVAAFAARLGFLRLRILSSDGRSQQLTYEEASWRQRLLVSSTNASRWRGGVTFLAAGLSRRIWRQLRPEETVLGPCSHKAMALAWAAKLGLAMGTLHFVDGCFYLLQKPSPASAGRIPGLAHLGRRDVVLIPSLKELGASGVGIRLGNALFTVAAGLALAADLGFSFRMLVGISWFKYSENGIFSELASSFWYSRPCNTGISEIDQIIGSPGNMGYAKPAVESGAATIVLHGYFQNLKYFWHRLDLVKGLLLPRSLQQNATVAWHQWARQHALGPTLAVHVRRGDRGAGLGRAYFQEAVNTARRQLKMDVGCVFFSDEPRKLRGWDLCRVFDAELRDDVALAVMAGCCCGAVLSASTFGWWAALLGGYQVVIAPQTDVPDCMPGAKNFTLGAVPGWTQIRVTCHAE
ncbi:unnamed protein product, partial [Effrenium voratum]